MNIFLREQIFYVSSPISCVAITTVLPQFIVLWNISHWNNIDFPNCHHQQPPTTPIQTTQTHPHPTSLLNP